MCIRDRSRMLASLWTQSRCSRVFGHTSRTAAQNPSAPSPIATTGARMPRRFRSRSTVFQLSALSRAVLDRDQLLRPVGSHANHDQRAKAIVVKSDVEVHAIDPDVHVVAVGGVPLLEGPVLDVPLVRSRARDTSAQRVPRKLALGSARSHSVTRCVTSTRSAVSAIRASPCS